MNRSFYIFKMDTGVSVSVVNENWAKGHKLSKLNQQLKGTGNIALTLIGRLKEKIRHKNLEMVETRSN